MEFGINLSPVTTAVVLVFVASYFVMITGFGVYFSRFSSNINDFFFSGQRFAWWLPFISMMATGIGSYSYLKYSEQGLNTGMSGSLGYLNDWFIFPLFFLGWLPLIYFSRLKSIPEYFEKRFNRPSRYIAVGILLAYMLYYIGYNFFTIGIALKGIFGLSPWVSLPVISLLLGLYVTLGGQTAVIFTDFVQGFLLYLAGFLAFGFGLYALGGAGEFWSHLPLSHRNPFPPFRSDPHFNSVGMFWGDALVGGVAFVFLNQGFLMRFLSIRSLGEARFAGICNILVTLPLSALTVGGMGWIAKAILTKQATLGGPLAGYDLLEIENSFYTFVVTAWQVIKHSPLVLGLILSALLSALMSTIDTLINASSAISVYDIYRPLIKPSADDKHYLKSARISSALFTLAGLLLAFWFFRQKGTLMSIHYKGIMMLMPSIALTLILGILWKRFNGPGAFSALTAGSMVSFLTLFFPEWIYPLRDFVLGAPSEDPIYLRALFGLITAGAAGAAVTFLTSPPPLEKVRGYTVDSLDFTIKKFKKGEPNFTKGGAVKNLELIVDKNLPEGSVSVSRGAAEQLKAGDGDIIYMADGRWYLGGLRSGHFRLTSCHGGESSQAHCAPSVLKKGYFLPARRVSLKKIL